MDKNRIFYIPVLKDVWSLTKKNYLTIFSFLVIYLLSTSLLNFFAESLKDNIVAFVLISIFSLIFGLLLTYFTAKLSLLVGRGGEVRLADLTKDISYKKVVIFLETYLLFGIRVFIGLILLIIPGFIWYFKYMFAPYFALEGHSVKDSAKYSKELTKDVKFKLFFLMFMFMVLFVISALPLLLGLFVTIPMAVVFTGVVFNKLKQASGFDLNNIANSNTVVSNEVQKKEEATIVNNNINENLAQADDLVQQPVELPEHSQN